MDEQRRLILDQFSRQAVPFSRMYARDDAAIHRLLPWVEGTDNDAPLKSLGWQLHVYGAATAGLRQFAAGARLPLHEWPWTGTARRAGLARHALYLVRRDGYFGFACRAQDVEGLRAYLGRFGIVAS